MSSLTPLYVPLVRPSLRPVRQQPAVAQALAQEPVYDTAPKRPTDAKATAARIVEMGRVRRAETPDRTSVPTHPIARAIVVAVPPKARAAPVGSSLKRCRLIPSRSRSSCGLEPKRPRGEINPDGERWLTDYVGKFEATRGLL